LRSGTARTRGGENKFELLLIKFAGLTPVHFFSHGSTMMLGEESESADYWKKCGDEALARNIKGVVIMVGIFWLSQRCHVPRLFL
jgi:aromatic ring-opening dioxygenase catalytic subunit (LigB family)